MESDDDDGELEMEDRGLDFEEVSEVSVIALAVLRALQRRLPRPPVDGLVLLNPQGLIGANAGRVTLDATALVAKGPGRTGALAATLARAAAQPLQPGHAAYSHEPGHTSYGLFAKVDLQPGQPICVYGGSVVTVSEVNAAQEAQLRVQPGRQGRPIVKSHLFDLPSFGQIGNARCLVADGAPIRSRQPDPSVPPHDVISRYFGALANAPSPGQAANLVALEFMGHGACGAGAQVQLRGADGKLTPLTGTDADLLLPLLVLVTNAPVPAGDELLLCYGKDYFKTIAAVSASADAVRWEEVRLAAGAPFDDEPGFATGQWWGHGEAAPEDEEEGRSDGGGGDGDGDIGDDDDNMPSPAAEAAAPEQSVDELLREAQAQRDTHAQTAAASAAQLADVALQERLRAAEAMDRARAALAKADAAQAAQTAAQAADAEKAAALDAEVRRLTSIKRKRESDVAAQHLEATRQEIADLRATLAAKEADAAALEAAREALLQDTQDAV